MDMSDEEWVNVALSDDSLVVDVLLRLNSPLPRLRWSLRSPRSAVKNSDAAAARASPTTPLTWTSSGGAGKSKNADESEVVATMKRPRKKKTLGELKEEEVLLLKEKKGLKDALATLRLTFEKQRSINGSLKKMKLDFQSQQAIDMVVTSPVRKEAISDDCQPKMPARSICNTTPVDDDASHQLPLTNISCKLQEMVTVHVLPDLNLPFQEDS